MNQAPGSFVWAIAFGVCFHGIKAQPLGETEASQGVPAEREATCNVTSVRAGDKATLTCFLPQATDKPIILVYYFTNSSEDKTTILDCYYTGNPPIKYRCEVTSPYSESENVSPWQKKLTFIANMTMEGNYACMIPPVDLNRTTKYPSCTFKLSQHHSGTDKESSNENFSDKLPIGIGITLLIVVIAIVGIVGCYVHSRKRKARDDRPLLTLIVGLLSAVFCRICRNREKQALQPVASPIPPTDDADSTAASLLDEQGRPNDVEDTTDDHSLAISTEQSEQDKRSSLAAHSVNSATILAMSPQTLHESFPSSSVTESSATLEEGTESTSAALAVTSNKAPQVMPFSMIEEMTPTTSQTMSSAFGTALVQAVTLLTNLLPSIMTKTSQEMQEFDENKISSISKDLKKINRQLFDDGDTVLPPPMHLPPLDDLETQKEWIEKVLLPFVGFKYFPRDIERVKRQQADLMVTQRKIKCRLDDLKRSDLECCSQERSDLKKWITDQLLMADKLATARCDALNDILSDLVRTDQTMENARHKMECISSTSIDSKHNVGLKNRPEEITNSRASVQSSIPTTESQLSITPN